MKQQNLSSNNLEDGSTSMPNENHFRIPNFETIRTNVNELNQEIIDHLKNNLILKSDKFLLMELMTFQTIISCAKRFNYTRANTFAVRLNKITPYLTPYCEQKPHQIELYSNLLYRCAELLVKGPSKSSKSSNNIADKDNALLHVALSLKTVSDALLPYQKYISLNLEPYETMALRCLNTAEEQFETTPCTLHSSSANGRFLAVYKRFVGYDWKNEYVNKGFKRRVSELENKIKKSHETQRVAKQSSLNHDFWGLNSLANLLSSSYQNDDSIVYEPLTSTPPGETVHLLPTKASNSSSGLHQRHCIVSPSL